MEERLLTPKQQAVLDLIHENAEELDVLLQRHKELIREFRELRLIEPMKKRLMSPNDL